jgi:tyrosyl-tRNA synthetase
MASPDSMDPAAKARFDLIADNLAEFLNPEIIESILAEGRNPRIYWGVSHAVKISSCAAY